MKEKFEIVPISINSDVHNHTKGSDGRQSSFRFLLRASHNGKNIISITDHDSVRGYKNLENDLFSVVETIKADKSYDPSKLIKMLEEIKILKGTELITSYNGVIIELLGYNFDVNKMQEEIDKLRGTVKENVDETIYQGFRKKILENNEGITLNEEVLDEAYKKVKEGKESRILDAVYVEIMAHKENMPLLRYKDEKGEEKQVDTLKLFLNKHMYNKQSPWFIDMSKTRPSYEDTIQAIHNAGGISSLAHCGKYNDKFDVLENIDDMIEKGLDCIEVFYPDHTYEFRKKLLEKVTEHGIKASGGTDDHYNKNEGIQYEMGRVSIPDIPETQWMQESVQNGLDFVKNSEKMQQAIQELKYLKNERKDKQNEKQLLEKEKTSNEEKEYE